MNRNKYVNQAQAWHECSHAHLERRKKKKKKKKKRKRNALTYQVTINTIKGHLSYQKLGKYSWPLRWLSSTHAFHEFSCQRLSMASAFCSNMGDGLVHGFHRRGFLEGKFPLRVNASGTLPLKTI